jgi:predicted RNase H-like HicB family nuclease
MRQVVLYPDQEDGGWVAEVPSLPGCISDGETKEEALANIKDAIKAWIVAADSLSMTVPADSGGVEVVQVN